MDNRINKAAESFITNLTGADAAELREYVAEITQNREFHDGIEEKRSSHGRRRDS
jgi:hypothetical protein